MRLLHQYHAVHPNLHSFPTRRSSDLDAPWVVGAPVPLADHVVLPRALQKKVDTHLMFSDGGLSLEQVAQRITLATVIPVRIQPEALLPPIAFLPRDFEGGAGVQGAASQQPLIRLQGPDQP